MVKKCSMKRKTLQEVLTNPQFIQFIEDLKKCSTVKVIYMVGGMVRRGESEGDVDIRVERTERNVVGDNEIYKLICSFPIRHPAHKKLEHVRYFMVGEIKINIWWGKNNGKFFIVLWRNESA